MNAQVIRIRPLAGMREKVDRVVHDQLLPALAREPGFGSHLELADEDTGETMLVLLWETEKHALKPFALYDQTAQQALGYLAALCEKPCPVTVWSAGGSLLTATGRHHVSAAGSPTSPATPPGHARRRRPRA
jgi:hypothetical protein